MPNLVMWGSEDAELGMGPAVDEEIANSIIIRGCTVVMIGGPAISEEESTTMVFAGPKSEEIAALWESFVALGPDRLESIQDIFAVLSEFATYVEKSP